MSEQRRGDGHLIIYLAWPLLSALALAATLALAALGLFALAGDPLEVAARAAGTVFFAALGVLAVALFAYAALSWAGPRFVERTRQSVIVEQVGPKIIENTPRPIVVNPHRPRLTPGADAPDYPALSQGATRRTIREALQALMGKASTQSVEARVNGEYLAEVESLEPGAPDWVREFYQVLCAMWGRPLTRRSFEEQFVARGQPLYYKYVGRSEGTRRERGLWQNWGILAQTGARGSWEFCHALEDILRSNAELWQYAQAREKLIKRSPIRRGEPGTGGRPVTEPNQTRKPNP